MDQPQRGIQLKDADVRPRLSQLTIGNFILFSGRWVGGRRERGRVGGRRERGREGGRRELSGFMRITKFLQAGVTGNVTALT